MEYYPDLVFLHISDAVAFSVKQKKLKKVETKILLESYSKQFLMFSLVFLDQNFPWYQIVVLLNV